MTPESVRPIPPDHFDSPELRRAREVGRAHRVHESAARAAHGTALNSVHEDVPSDTQGATQSSAVRSAIRRPWVPSSKKYTFGVVILTQGKRPADLKRGIDSLLAQRGVELDVVCVGNGWEPSGLPDGVKTLALPQNVGIPAGRNEGVPHVAGEFIFFLDDDAWLPDDTTLMRMAQLTRTKPSIGLIQARVEDPTGPKAPRRWIPRLNKRAPSHSSNVFSVWEGAVCLQRKAYDKAGGWPAPFWYAHEGIELAWRIWDAGYQVWYMGDVVVAHPVIDQRRHDEYFFMNARNRVWLARRNLPWPLGLAYVGSWTLMQTVAWSTKPGQLKPWFDGWRAGWKDDPWGADETPHKLSGMGVMRMAVHGRPPIV